MPGNSERLTLPHPAEAKATLWAYSALAACFTRKGYKARPKDVSTAMDCCLRDKTAVPLALASIITEHGQPNPHVQGQIRLSAGRFAAYYDTGAAPYVSLNTHDRQRRKQFQIPRLDFEESSVLGEPLDNNPGVYFARSVKHESEVFGGWRYASQFLRTSGGLVAKLLTVTEGGLGS